jgi:hypothetical protein
LNLDLNLVAYFIAGVATAVAYLGLLWGSVSLVVSARQYLPLLLGTVLRFGLLFLMGFAAIVLGATAPQLVAAVAGFLVSRILILRFMQMPLHGRDHGAR